jgi:electron transfer flavoprotein beta subunit
MKIVVVLRQVPDLIEPLEVSSSGTALDLERASFLVNESDDHALEQALLIKEAGGAEVVVVAFDYGDVDNTLFSAAAKGADQIIKIPLEDEALPAPAAMVAMLAKLIKTLQADLILIGCQAHNELEGALAPRLAAALDLPYAGVIRGVRLDGDASKVRAFKEFPGAVMARLSVRLPAVLGILAAEQPPRYVPVSRIRAAMQSTRFDEQAVAAPALESMVKIRSIYPPQATEHAEMIDGSEQQVADRISAILAEKGFLK